MEGESESVEGSLEEQMCPPSNQANSKRLINGRQSSEKTCSLCHKSYSSNYSLKRHVDLNHACMFCEQTFVARPHLLKHLKDDHGGYTHPFRCDMCDTSFFYKYSLSRHMKTVHGNERAVCNVCKKEYRRQDNLNHHMLAAHGTHDQAKTPSREGHYAERQKKADVDVQDVSRGNLTFSCQVCDKSYRRKYNLSRHMKTAHDFNGNLKREKYAKNGDKLKKHGAKEQKVPKLKKLKVELDTSSQGIIDLKDKKKYTERANHEKTNSFRVDSGATEEISEHEFDFDEQELIAETSHMENVVDPELIAETSHMENVVDPELVTETSHMKNVDDHELIAETSHMKNVDDHELVTETSHPEQAEYMENSQASEYSAQVYRESTDGHYLRFRPCEPSGYDVPCSIL